MALKINSRKGCDRCLSKHSKCIESLPYTGHPLQMLEKKVPVPSELKTYRGWEKEINNNYSYNMSGALVKCSDENSSRARVLEKWERLFYRRLSLDIKPAYDTYKSRWFLFVLVGWLIGWL